MPEKQNLYRSYGEKLISLFGRLLYSGESYSLTELSRMLGCSKQSVMRLVDDIRRAYRVEIEESLKGKRKYYRMKRPPVSVPSLPLTDMEMSVLWMSQAFAKHLLGERLFDEATQALLKSRISVPEEGRASTAHFGAMKPGSIDYTGHQEIFHQLITAMADRRICEIRYKAMWDGRAKRYFIKPLKIFSHKDTVYLHARKARAPGEPYREADFDPLLAVHRIQELTITDRYFSYPSDYNFEALFNRDFGVIKDKAFKVEVAFTGWAAGFVSERTWSPDQKILRKKDGSLRLSFSTSSEPELISWVLGFREEARVIKPKWLVNEVKKALSAAAGNYQ